MKSNNFKVIIDNVGVRKRTKTYTGWLFYLDGLEDFQDENQQNLVV